MATLAQRENAQLRLAFIPDSFDRPLREPLDRGYMNALFLVGYELARNGYPWAAAPPGMQPR